MNTKKMMNKPRHAQLFIHTHRLTYLQVNSRFTLLKKRGTQLELQSENSGFLSCCEGPQSAKCFLCPKVKQCMGIKIAAHGRYFIPQAKFSATFV